MTVLAETAESCVVTCLSKVPVARQSYCGESEVPQASVCAHGEGTVLRRIQHLFWVSARAAREMRGVMSCWNPMIGWR